MAAKEIRNHALTTNYLGNEQVIPDGCSQIEVWGVDAVPRTADAAITFRLTSQATTPVVAEVHVGAGVTYYKDLGRFAGGWTYNVKADAATPVAYVVLS